MQLSILTSILQSRVRYAAQSRVLGWVRFNNNNNNKPTQYGIIIIQVPAVCVYCVVGVSWEIMMSYTAALIGEA